jgi:hypothetical protein
MENKGDFDGCKRDVENCRIQQVAGRKRQFVQRDNKMALSFLTINT